MSIHREPALNSDSSISTGPGGPGPTKICRRRSAKQTAQIKRGGQALVQKAKFTIVK